MVVMMVICDWKLTGWSFVVNCWLGLIVNWVVIWLLTGYDQQGLEVNWWLMIGDLLMIGCSLADDDFDYSGC